MDKYKNFLNKAYKFSNSWTGTIIIVLLIIFFVAQAFVIPSGSMISTLLIGDHLFVKKFSYGVSIPRIPWLEISVFPDLHNNGHIIEGERPKRGDVVIFRFPEDEKIHYVKRCVAVGGDEIFYRDQELLIHPHEGDTYVQANYPKEQIVDFDGKLFIKNPYVHAHPGIHYDGDGDAFTQLSILMQTKSIAMVPIITDRLLGFYYRVPNDEYFMMGDNRDNSYDSRFWGSVPYKYIVGKPWFIYFSWDSDPALMGGNEEKYKIRWERIGKSVEDLEDTMREVK